MNGDDKLDNFTEEQLIILLNDVMFPAFSAIPSVITHVIKYLMHHPRILEKVQNEIDNVVGTGRLATWDDRKKWVYDHCTVKGERTISFQLYIDKSQEQEKMLV